MLCLYCWQGAESILLDCNYRLTSITLRYAQVPATHTSSLFLYSGYLRLRIAYAVGRNQAGYQRNYYRIRRPLVAGQANWPPNLVRIIRRNSSDYK